MNNFSSAFPTIVSRMLEKNAKPKQLFRQLAQMNPDGEIVQYGDRFSQQSISRGKTYQYRPGENLGRSTYNTVGTDLVVDKMPSGMFELDDVHNKQSKPALSPQIVSDTSKDIANAMDREFLYEGAIPAESVIDAGDFGGTAGQGLVLTTSNVYDVLSRSTTMLAALGQDTYNAHGCLSPYEIEIIQNAVAGRETQFGDKLTKDGIPYQGGRSFMYNGRKIYETLNHTVTDVLYLDSAPTNGDDVVISLPNVFGGTPDTVTLNFVSTIGSAAGNILQTGTADQVRDRVVNFINNPTVTNANQVGFDPEADKDELALLGRFVAEAGGAGEVVLRCKAGEHVSYDTSGLTDGDSGIVAAKSVRNLFMACDKATSIVVQKDIRVENERIQSQFGDRWKWLTLFGVKTFLEAQKKIVRLDIRR